MKKILVIIALLPLIFAACKKEIEFSGNEGKQYVVVMAQLEPDSAAVVNLTYSRFFLSDAPSVKITDAIMRLWVNETLVGTLDGASADGSYRFPTILSAGDTVRFEADVPGHGTISGGTRVVTAPQIGTDCIVSATTGYDFWRMMDLQYVQFTLTDPADEHDYYRIELIEHDYRPADEEQELKDTLYFSTFLFLGLKEVGDTALTDIFTAQMASSFVVSDSSFRGESKWVSLMSMPIVDTTRQTTYDYWVRVTTYSPELYKFRASASLASSSAAMFAEPMQVYSNIQGDAIGIFASRATRVVKATRVVIPTPDEP